MSPMQVGRERFRLNQSEDLSSTILTNRKNEQKGKAADKKGKWSEQLRSAIKHWLGSNRQSHTIEYRVSKIVLQRY